MTAWELSSGQKGFVEHPPGQISVTACPGAGKTRTIVSRYIKRASELQPATAAAVLSFTNAAIDEVRSRCLEIGRSELLRFPNFVGTFDAFINRYFVLPFSIPEVSRPYRVVESWQSRHVMVKRRGVSCEGFSLDALAIGDDFRGTLDERRIPSRVRSQVRSEWAEWERAALAKREQMHKTGFLSCEDARALAARRIKHPKSKHLAHALASRFGEIIVDEAQDCDGHQLAILSWLRGAGTSVVTVCDPDQSIYEFRNAIPASLRLFQGGTTPIRLTGNYRSSPAICALAASLRTDQAVDQAVGKLANCNTPISVQVYEAKKPGALADWFSAHLDSLRIALKDAIILSHRAADGLKVIGRDPGEELSNSIAGRLLVATRDFQSPMSDAAVRKRAVTETQSLLLKCMDESDSEEIVPELADISKVVDLRTMSCELLASLDVTVIDWNRWCTEVRAKIKSVDLPPSLTWRTAAIGTPRSVFPLATRSSNAPVAAATVHSAKGQEYDAILLVIPDKGTDTDSLLDAWRDRTESEPKRVVYVAVTRARKSASIAVPSKYHQRLVEILSKAAVPFEIQQV